MSAYADQEPRPDPARLRAAREGVQTFLRRKKSMATALFVLTCIFEVGFFAMMMVFMDASSRRDWFILAAVLFVYCPLITFAWRNAVKMDHLFYQLVDELKYGGPSKSDQQQNLTPY